MCLYHRWKKVEKSDEGIKWMNRVQTGKHYLKKSSVLMFLVSNVCIQNILEVKMSGQNIPCPSDLFLCLLPCQDTLLQPQWLFLLPEHSRLSLNPEDLKTCSLPAALFSSWLLPALLQLMLKYHERPSLLPSLRSMPCLPLCMLSYPCSPPLVLFLFEFPGQDLENTTHGRCSINIH